MKSHHATLKKKKRKVIGHCEPNNHVKLKYKYICVKANENDGGCWKTKDFLRLLKELNFSICDVQCAFVNGTFSINTCLLEEKVGLLKGFGCILCLDKMTLDWILGLQLGEFTICITNVAKDDDQMCCVTNNIVYFHPLFPCQMLLEFHKPNSINASLKTVLSGMH